MKAATCSSCGVLFAVPDCDRDWEGVLFKECESAKRIHVHPGHRGRITYESWHKELMKETDDFELDERLRLASNSVPWKREGTPGWTYSKDMYRSKWGIHILNVGIASDRLYTDEQMVAWNMPDLAFERAFAQYWDHQVNNRSGSTTYEHLRFNKKINALINDDDSERLFQLTLQAFAQWLGTSVGNCFHEEAKRFAQEEVKRVRTLIEPDYPKKLKADEERSKKWEKERFDEEVSRRVEQESGRRAAEIVEERIRTELLMRVLQEVERREEIAKKKWQEEMEAQQGRLFCDRKINLFGGEDAKV